MTTDHSKKVGNWLDSERQALTPPREMTVSEWADTYRKLPAGSARPGQWETDFAAYLREPMDCANDDDVEQVTMVCGAQVGKTETLLNVMGYRICEDPAPMLYVMPRDDDWDDVSRDRLDPMLDNTEAIWEHMRDDPDALTKRRLQFDRCTIFFAGAGSPAALASRPIHTVFLDEVDKYPAWGGKEADPISLAAVRTRTFWNRKIYAVSTPTTRLGYIWALWEKSDQRRFWIPCPHCGRLQVLKWANVKWPKDVRDPEQIKSEGLARYECAHCAEPISDGQKGAALRKGKWVQSCATVEEDGTVTGEQPHRRHRGYHLPALYSRTVTWASLVAEWLEAQNDPGKLQHFFNSTLAETWQERLKNTDEDKLLRLVHPYDPRQVPNSARVLTGGVDLSEGLLYYEIRAWGADEESWLIDAGRVETNEALERLMFESRFRTFDERHEMQVRLVLIDVGYDRDRMMPIVQRWPDRARAIRGASHDLKGELYSPGKSLDRDYDGRARSDGIRLWWLATDALKDRLHRLMSTTGDRGGYHIHRATTEQWREQMASEHQIRVRKGGREIETWEPKTKGRKNHWFDTAVYNVAAAEMLGVPGMPVEEASAKPAESDGPLLGQSPSNLGRRRR